MSGFSSRTIRIRVGGDVDGQHPRALLPHSHDANRCRAYMDPLKQVDVDTEVMSNDEPDDIGMRYAADIAFWMAGAQVLESRRRSQLDLAEALAVRKACRRRPPLYS